MLLAPSHSVVDDVSPAAARIIWPLRLCRPTLLTRPRTASCLWPVISNPMLCTTNSANGRGVDNDGSSGSKKKGPKLPFKLPELPFQNELTKSIAVTQRIRCMDEDAVGDAKVIDRVDNIIEFTPFADTVGDLLGDSMPFAALKDLTLNPLEVKKSKVTLVHKAEVQSLAPVLRTKINLQSYVRE